MPGLTGITFRAARPRSRSLILNRLCILKTNIHKVRKGGKNESRLFFRVEKNCRLFGWKYYSTLTETVRKQARATYKQFQKDPYYSSLHFKQVHSTRPIYSVRITKEYRAVGIIQGEDIIWFWTGNHSDYDKILRQL